MKAVRVDKQGTSTVVSVQEIPKPSIKPGELLVQIKASFVQPADILNSKGSFKSTTFPRTLGKDFSGTVVEGSDRWKGKDVYGTSGSTFSFVEDGAQAEYAVLMQDAVAPKPHNLSWAQAAAIGTPFTTAYTALLKAQTRPEDAVMILGATGSVGSAAMQIAKSMGCRVYGVGRHDTEINSKEDPTLQKAKELTGGKGPNVVFDTVGDFALTQAAFQVMAVGGRMSIISAPRQGSTQLAIDILDLYRRQVSLIGVNTAGMPQTEMARLMAELSPKFEAGTLAAPADDSMTLVKIENAEEVYKGNVKRAVIIFA